MRRRLRLSAALLAATLPWPARRWIYTRLLGHRLAPSARVGRALIDVERLEMGPESWIGTGTVIRGCELVVLETDAAIGNLNLINAVREDTPYFAGESRWPALIMRRGARISGLHFVDCSDELELGPFASIIGALSQVLTHSMRTDTARQHTAPIRLGAYSLVATSCVVLPGVTVAPYAVVGAKSLVQDDLPESHALYVGTPAQKKRDLDPALAYFSRTRGDIA